MFKSLAPLLVIASLLAPSLDAQVRSTKSPDRARSAVGVNMTELRSYSSHGMFVDIFKMSSPWLPQRVSDSTWDTGASLNLDAAGYITSFAPDQAAGTVMASAGCYPEGLYTFLYDGEGTVDFFWDARIVSSRPGRIEVYVTPNSGIYMKLTSTNPANYMRNMRMIMPGFENIYQTKPFYPPSIAKWTGFGVFRFMNWQNTTTTDLAQWADRPLTTWKSQDNEYGVALEHMIDLCNETGVDPWFCLPHLATDNFVQQFATMVHTRLNPDRRVYVEYSNEVWNGIFQAYWHSVGEGLRLGFSNDTDQAALRYYSYRSVQIFDIFRNVFTDDSRIVRLLGTQHAVPGKGVEIMDWQNAFQKSDALAVAVYAGTSLGEPSNLGLVLSKTPTELVIEAAIRIPNTMNLVRQNAANANARGLRLIASEGGQHLVGLSGLQFNDAVTQKFTAANRDPLMDPFYTIFMDEWKRNGGTTFLHFESVGRFTNWGSFGLLEHDNQDLLFAPKYRSVLRFSVNNPEWW